MRQNPNRSHRFSSRNLNFLHKSLTFSCLAENGVSEIHGKHTDNRSHHRKGLNGMLTQQDSLGGIVNIPAPLNTPSLKREKDASNQQIISEKSTIDAQNVRRNEKSCKVEDRKPSEEKNWAKAVKTTVVGDMGQEKEEETRIPEQDDYDNTKICEEQGKSIDFTNFETPTKWGDIEFQDTVIISEHKDYGAVSETSASVSVQHEHQPKSAPIDVIRDRSYHNASHYQPELKWRTDRKYESNAYNQWSAPDNWRTGRSDNGFSHNTRFPPKDTKTDRSPNCDDSTITPPSSNVLYSQNKMNIVSTECNIPHSARVSVLKQQLETVRPEPVPQHDNKQESSTTVVKEIPTKKLLYDPSSGEMVEPDKLFIRRSRPRIVKETFTSKSKGIFERPGENLRQREQKYTKCENESKISASKKAERDDVAGAKIDSIPLASTDTLGSISKEHGMKTDSRTRQKIRNERENERKTDEMAKKLDTHEKDALPLSAAKKGEAQSSDNLGRKQMPNGNKWKGSSERKQLTKSSKGEQQQIGNDKAKFSSKERVEIKHSIRNEERPVMKKNSMGIRIKISGKPRKKDHRKVYVAKVKAQVSTPRNMKSYLEIRKPHEVIPIRDNIVAVFPNVDFDIQTELESMRKYENEGFKEIKSKKKKLTDANVRFADSQSRCKLPRNHSALEQQHAGDSISGKDGVQDKVRRKHKKGSPLLKNDGERNSSKEETTKNVVRKARKQDIKPTVMPTKVNAEASVECQKKKKATKETPRSVDVITNKKEITKDSQIEKPSFSKTKTIKKNDTEMIKPTKKPSKRKEEKKRVKEKHFIHSKKPIYVPKNLNVNQDKK